jgi:hypothetical protein
VQKADKRGKIQNLEAVKAQKISGKLEALWIV